MPLMLFRGRHYSLILILLMEKEKGSSMQCRGLFLPHYWKCESSLHRRRNEHYPVTVNSKNRVPMTSLLDPVTVGLCYLQ